MTRGYAAEGSSAGNPNHPCDNLAGTSDATAGEFFCCSLPRLSLLVHCVVLLVV